MIHPTRTPYSASAYRAPMSRASVITASGIPVRWNAYGPNWNSAYRTCCAARLAVTPRTSSEMSSGSVISRLTD